MQTNGLKYTLQNRLRRIFFVLLLLAPSAVCFAGSASRLGFPQIDLVEDQRQFWVKIFAVYTSKHIVIHDRDFPSILIDVIDFDQFAKRFNEGLPYTNQQKQRIADAYKARYEKALKRFANQGALAGNQSAMEKRIEQVYSKHPGQMQRVLRGQVAIRTQTGLSDTFKKAADIADQYLPYMERIFAYHKLPPELTRIAFVESMFNFNAKSKVGASGIWQFMPSTAKQFMVVNRLIDERNSPLKATAGAAQLLKHNYDRLGSWPLAITAYNHGAGGMLKAVKRVKSRDLNRIIKEYRAPSFGFASKNFYAEFLAARDVFNGIYGKSVRSNQDPLNIVNLKLQKPISLHQLIKYTPLDENTIKRLNLCLSEKIFDRYRYRPLPTNFELIVPKSHKRQIKLALTKIQVSSSKNKGYKL